MTGTGIIKTELVFTLPFETADDAKAAHEFNQELKASFEIVSFVSTPFDCRITASVPKVGQYDDYAPWGTSELIERIIKLESLNYAR